MSKATRPVSAFLLLALIISLLASCAAGGVSVTFVYNNGDEAVTASASLLSKVTRPEDPTYKNHIFIGWYSDEALSQPYSFNESITHDITLYAGWQPDLEKFSAMVSTVAQNACLAVRVIHYEKELTATIRHTVSGSGVVYKQLGEYFYFLTNHHVVEKIANAASTEYSVFDAYGGEHDCELLYSDASYDLALMRFKYDGDKPIGVLKISSEIPDKNQAVCAIGTPKSQLNTVTYGKIKNYKKVETTMEGSDNTEVKFEVLWHSAYTNHGSSGGALINMDMEIVGINYASGADSEGNFSCGFSIPAERVLEFLNMAEAK